MTVCGEMLALDRLAVIHMGAGIDIAWGDLSSALAANK